MIKKLLPRVPVVLFTMYADQVGRTLAAAAGVDSVVAKEGIAQIIASVERLLTPREPGAVAD